MLDFLVNQRVVVRLLPELMLMVVGLLVLGSDILERWGSDAEEQTRRSRAAGELTASMLGLVFVVALVLTVGYSLGIRVYRMTNRGA